MDIDTDKIDEAVLALLYLTLHEGVRAWKGHDWDALGRLYRKGMINDPVGKTKSVVLTDEGLAASERLFTKLFAKTNGTLVTLRVLVEQSCKADAICCSVRGIASARSRLAMTAFAANPAACSFYRPKYVSATRRSSASSAAEPDSTMRPWSIT